MTKRNVLLALALVACVAFVSCTKIEAGYVGLKVSLLGDDKGAVVEVPSGRYFNMSPNVEYLRYPTFVQIAKWTEDSVSGSKSDEAIRFQSSEGLQIVSDVGMDYHFNPERGYVAEIFKTYRKSPQEIADVVIRNRVRDSLVKFGSEYTADSIISTGKVELMNRVQEDVREQFMLAIEITGVYWLADPRPPQSVIDALNAKVTATQVALQRENEVKTAEAEAKKKVAEAQGQAESILTVAKAQAEANRIISNSLTPLLVESKKVERWNGELPTVTSGNGTIIDMR